MKFRAGLRYFPVRAGAKAPPLVRDWPAKATSDPTQLRAWRKQYPDCNWAVHTQDLIVLDVDVVKGGKASLKALPRRPRTFTVRTPSGGLHLYFRGKGRNSVGVLGPGLDVRADHGYVIAAGSQVDGKSYTVARDAPIADAPDWLARRASAGRPASTAGYQRREVKLSPRDEDLAIEYARNALDFRPPAIQDQGGDEWTLKTVSTVRSYGVPERRAPEAMADWNARCEPPWSPEELAQKIRNAYRYNREPFGVNHPAIAFARPLPKLYGPGDISLESVLRTNYLVKGWLDQGSMALLFGAWGGGKTFAAMNLAAHVAAGEPWCGCAVSQGGVLLLAYEGTAAIQRRAYALTKQYEDWDWSQVPFRIYAMNRPLVQKPRVSGAENPPKGQLEVTAILKEFEQNTGNFPALIVVDPLRNALGGSDSDADLTGAYLAWASKLAQERGCTVLTVHHPGHGDQERGRGDSAIEAHMDTVLRLDKAAYRLYARKQRDEAQLELYYDLKPMPLGLDSDGDPVTTCVFEQVDPGDSSLTHVERTLLAELVRAAGVDGKITKGQANQVVSGLRMSKIDARRVLASLEDKGKLVATSKGYDLVEAETDGDS